MQYMVLASSRGGSMTPRPALFLAVFSSGISGCAEPVFPLESDVEKLEWEWVDFHSDECKNCQCDAGCSQTRLILTQIHKDAVTIDMPNGHDTDHICIEGYPAGTEFQPLEMQPSERLVLDVSVCGYLAGELNLEDQEPPLPVEGTLVFSSGLQKVRPMVIPWSFIPYREQGGLDTGQ
jgi:hypothetical protein